MPANESTVFQFNVKQGDWLHNVYASNGQEALELLDFFSEQIVPKLTALHQQVNGAAAVAQAVQVAPVAQQNVVAPPTVTTPPFAQAPQAQPAAHLCEHGQPMRLVPAGVSKATGKPYGAFYACAQPRGQQCQARVSA